MRSEAVHVWSSSLRDSAQILFRLASPSPTDLDPPKTPIPSRGSETGRRLEKDETHAGHYSAPHLSDCLPEAHGFPETSKAHRHFEAKDEDDVGVGSKVFMMVGMSKVTKRTNKWHEQHDKPRNENQWGTAATKSFVVSAP